LSVAGVKEVEPDAVSISRHFFSCKQNQE